MKIPKTVTILGRKFALKQASQEVIDEYAGSPVEACVDIENSIILVRKDISDNDKILAIFHEAHHIAHYISGVSQVVSPEIQEIICEISSQAIADLLRSLHGARK